MSDHAWGASYTLRVSAGLGCRLTASDTAGAGIAAQLAQIMRLETATDLDEGLPRLWLTTDPAFSPPPGEESYRLPALDQPEALYCCLAETSAALARILLRGGALLLHAALVAVPTHLVGLPEAGWAGVLLAAAGGTGKSTAARRVPPPWLGLCDDAVLVIPEWGDLPANPESLESPEALPQRWWAHAWPTWSRFEQGGPGGVWPVREAIPLRAIYFLKQAAGEWLEPFGTGQTAARLHESAKQINLVMLRYSTPQEKQAIQRKLFNLSTALARCLPAARLHLSLQGAFWTVLEADLAAKNRKD